ncbi:MAG: hypothetical protein CMD39_11830 [Gammaproteobacteria bacterium]|nr:hypothetical protein [Gammaproteobacteria bacterium]
MRIHRLHAAAAGLLAELAAAGCSPEHPPIQSCEPGDGLVPDCRFQNPEDLVPAPGATEILVSQFGGMAGEAQGSLVALRPADGRIRTLFPDPAAALEPEAAWGDPACPPPPAFSPHGIDIEQLDDGRHALYVVNHAGRESVEMFEVTPGADVTLTWRGCVEAPENGFFNDLVVLRDGGFWVSHMFPRDANLLWTVLRMQLTGHAPGLVYRWQPDAGFTAIPGTAARFANGVEKSADERFLFLNSYLGSRVLKVDVSRGEVVASAEVSSPDNLAWDGGTLLAASHLASLADSMSCQELESGSCGFRFQIVAIDPADMSTEVRLDHAGPPMGGATVALPFDGALYLGTFAGDRIARAGDPGGRP